jgi:hypothetical protein
MTKKRQQVIEFCSVALIQELETLKQTIPLLKKWNKPRTHWIICPSKEVKKFQKSLNQWKHVQVIDENSIIELDNFRIICNQVLKSRDDLIDINASWYYQQVLKLGFCLSRQFTNKTIIIWDADTVPITAIKFVDSKTVRTYGSLAEYEDIYRLSNQEWLGRDLKPSQYSYITQFSAITPAVHSSLITSIIGEDEKFCQEIMPEKIARKMMQAVSNLKKPLKNPSFSEYELIGHVSTSIYGSKQTPILGLRWEIEGQISRMQIRLLRLMGYKYIAYENRCSQENTQSWQSLLKGIYTSLRQARKIRQASKIRQANER